MGVAAFGLLIASLRLIERIWAGPTSSASPSPPPCSRTWSTRWCAGSGS